ncbi:hypothetical protein GCM10020220_047620 [Nonomuraea rubra]
MSFGGRTRDLRTLRDALASCPNGLSQVAIVGLGRVATSELALLRDVVDHLVRGLHPAAWEGPCCVKYFGTSAKARRVPSGGRSMPIDSRRALRHDRRSG